MVTELKGAEQFGKEQTLSPQKASELSACRKIAGILELTDQFQLQLVDGSKIDGYRVDSLVMVIMPAGLEVEFEVAEDLFDAAHIIITPEVKDGKITDVNFIANPEYYPNEAKDVPKPLKDALGNMRRQILQSPTS